MPKLLLLLLLVVFVPLCLGGHNKFDQCEDEKCCEERQIPNEQTGDGYLQFKKRCLVGGLHCLQNSGCALCRHPKNKQDTFRPICKRFKKKEEEKPYLQCHDEYCCLSLEKEKGENDEHLQYRRRCLWGGKNCMEKSGCQWCRSEESNDKKKPICKRFMRDEPKKCYHEECCRSMESEYDGRSHLEYDRDCHWYDDKDECFHTSGCRKCRSHHWRDSKLPICHRFHYEEPTYPKCYDDKCCNEIEEAHKYKKDWYLEYRAYCHWGGEFCLNNTGCQYCQKKEAKMDKWPVCRKYDDFTEKKCHDHDCCKKILYKDYNLDEEEKFEYRKECKKGGKYCHEKTGCGWCKSHKKAGDYDDMPLCDLSG